MKALHKIKNLPLLVFGVGLVCILLRAALYALGPDERGLINNYHPLQLFTVLLTAATAWHIATVLRQTSCSGGIVLCEKALVFLSLVSTLLFAANGYIALEQAGDRFDLIRAGLSIAAVPCFAAGSLTQKKEAKHNFIFFAFITVFFAVDLICRYRIWSGNPQLVDYMFPLLACVCLMLTAYYRTASCTGLGNRKKLLFFSLMAALFCITAPAGTEHLPFYLGGMIWAISGICSPGPSGEGE